MVDVVVNNVMALSQTPDYSKYMFNDASLYHPYCPVDFSNTTSEQICWLGDSRVPLPDLDTKNARVIKMYGDWIQNMIQTYDIDGLRIDGKAFLAGQLHCCKPILFYSRQARGR